MRLGAITTDCMAQQTMAAYTRRLQGSNRWQILPPHIHRPIYQIPDGGDCEEYQLGPDKRVMNRMIGIMGLMDTITTDGGPPYSGAEFGMYCRKMGIQHRICTPKNPQANGFVEVFQKVLIKLVHTAIAEKKEPREMIDQYLMSYKAAPHKTTGKSLYELLFGRKMKTMLPQLMSKPSQKEDEYIREKHDERKSRRRKALTGRTR